MVMPYHLHMPSYFLETFTEYPWIFWKTLAPDCLKVFVLFLQLRITDSSVIHRFQFFLKQRFH